VKLIYIMHIIYYYGSRFSASKMQFLSRVSILTRNIDIANLSVCLSVRRLRSGIV